MMVEYKSVRKEYYGQSPNAIAVKQKESRILTILKTLLKELNKQKIYGGGFRVGDKYVILEVKEVGKDD
jgi:hypothetical protein